MKTTTKIKLPSAPAEVKRHATSTLRFNFALMTAHQYYKELEIKTFGLGSRTRDVCS